MKPNKQNIISEILLDLETGTERAPCLAKIVKKWQISVRTFDRHWKEANTAHLRTLVARRKEIADQTTDLEKGRAKQAVLSREELLTIASTIARGGGRQVGTEILIPTDSDRLKACDFLSKLENHYPAKKVDVTTNGKDFPTQSATIIVNGHALHEPVTSEEAIKG
jgi:hypothetical protein